MRLLSHYLFSTRTRTRLSPSSIIDRSMCENGALRMVKNGRPLNGEVLGREAAGSRSRRLLDDTRGQAVYCARTGRDKRWTKNWGPVAAQVLFSMVLICHGQSAVSENIQMCSPQLCVCEWAVRLSAIVRQATSAAAVAILPLCSTQWALLPIGTRNSMDRKQSRPPAATGHIFSVFYSLRESLFFFLRSM